MKINIAKSAGFCFGVKRAVDTVYKESSKKNVYTFGPIIHNDEVVADLERQGVHVINDSKEFKSLSEGTIIIRSHGVSKAIYEEILNAGLDLVDATCPFVRKIHKIVERESGDGRVIIIIGNNHHPEVEGIMGWCQTHPIVIENREQAEGVELDADAKISIVSQTTFNYNKFQDLVEIISEKGYDINVFNTICNATEERQTEVRELAKKSDAMIVIGGRHSSNTQKLFEISKKECSNTFYIQTKNDLNMEDFSNIGMLGITAGASTPNNIIKEVHESMAEMSFDQMLEESFKTIRNGEVVQGTIIDVKEDEIILNIGYKADGIISRNEYSNDQNLDLTTVAKVGDEMEAKVLKVNDGEGQVLLTYKRLKAEKGNKRLEEAFNNHEVLKAPVAKVLDGGLSVVVEDTRVFIPASQTGVPKDGKLEELLKKTVPFKVIEVTEARGRVVGSIRQAKKEANDAAKAKFWENIEVGQKFTGEVKSIESYGVFVDLGGVDGMVHSSELTWNRIKHPREIVKIGDKLDVYVKSFDPEKKRVSLGCKKEEDNPWNKFVAEYHEGDVVDVTIVSITPFGAFAQIIPGVDGLIHISQISTERINNVAQVLSIGDEVKAKIIEINEEQNRVSLSIRALKEEMPEDEEEEAEDAE